MRYPPESLLERSRRLTRMAGVETRAGRVVMFPLPYQGNLSPMLHLAGALHKRGLAVTILHTTFNAPDPMCHPEFAFVPVPIDIPDAVSAGNESNMSIVFDLNAAIEASGNVRDALASLVKSRKEGEHRVACLICDAALPAVQKVAADLGLPRLVLHTGSAACFRMFGSYDMLYGKGYLPAQEFNLNFPVEELPPLQVKDLFDPSKLPNQAIVQKIFTLWNQTKINSGIIINTFDALEAHELHIIRDELTISGVAPFVVGPLHKLSCINGSKTTLFEEDRSCIEWLDTQAPCSVLYVSFGSLAHLTEDEFRESAWGLANSGKPFLWVIRRGLVLGETELPEGFEHAVESRGKIVEWAPQQEVLAHSAVGGFWTHSGWNSTLESILEGVPMLSRPIFGDQFATGRYIESVWKIGFLLEGKLDKGEIERLIRRLLEEKQGVEIRERAKNLKKKALMSLENYGSSQQAADDLVHHVLSL